MRKSLLALVLSITLLLCTSCSFSIQLFPESGPYVSVNDEAMQLLEN